MARPLKTESERTAGEILPAAERAFGARGFDGTRLADIAASAGISRPSLLYHYPSKEALYAAVVRWAFGDLAARLAGVLSAPRSSEAALVSVVEAFRSFLGERPSLSRLLVRELMNDRGPGRAVLVAEIVPLLDLVEAGLSSGGENPLGLRMREAVVTVAASMVLRAASGDLGPKLWGVEDGSESLAAALVLGRRAVLEVG